jgi:hypothetical protein
MLYDPERESPAIVHYTAKFGAMLILKKKFLQALGYASSFEYDPAKEERIQMHADKLYHQMLDYEERVKEAKAAGTEIPPVTSLFHPEKGPQPPSQEQVPEGSKAKVVIPGGEPIPEGLKPSKPLWQLTPHERELEIRSHNAQLEQQKLYFEEASPFVKAQEETRTKRQEKAVSWFGETLGKWMS